MDDEIVSKNEILEMFSKAQPLLQNNSLMYEKEFEFQQGLVRFGRQKSFWGSHIYKLPNITKVDHEPWKKQLARSLGFQRNGQMYESSQRGHAPFSFESLG